MSVIHLTNATQGNIAVDPADGDRREVVIAGAIGAGQSHRLTSSPGHELRVREYVSRRLLTVFIVDATPERQITIDYTKMASASADAVKPEAPKEESDEVKESRRAAQESDAVGVTSTEVFAKYTPTHPQPGCEHPADVSEAASLAATTQTFDGAMSRSTQSCAHAAHRRL